MNYQFGLGCHERERLGGAFDVKDNKPAAVGSDKRQFFE